MNVDVENLQRDLDLGDPTPIVKAVLELEGEKADEVSIRFVDLQTSAEIHEEHFNDPTPTDCMSFPMDPPNTPHRVLGDVVVCPKIALEYPDPHTECTLYLVHSLLHLIGYRDKEEEETVQMRAAEERHMENLRRLGLSLHPSSS